MHRKRSQNFKKYVSGNYPALLFWISVVVWVVLAIDPISRKNWALENILVFVTVPGVVYLYKKHLLSKFSCALIFPFLILHLIGAHYTYGKVAFTAEISEWLGLKRNYFDRLVHFSYGFLMTAPIAEVFKHRLRTGRKRIYLVTVCFIMTTGVVYELIEWAGAQLGPAEEFLATQGDKWDAQKDLGVKMVGAMLSWVWVRKVI